MLRLRPYKKEDADTDFFTEVKNLNLQKRINYISLIYHMLEPDERYIYGLDEVEINGV